MVLHLLIIQPESMFQQSVWADYLPNLKSLAQAKFEVLLRLAIFLPSCWYFTLITFISANATKLKVVNDTHYRTRLGLSFLLWGKMSFSSAAQLVNSFRCLPKCIFSSEVQMAAWHILKSIVVTVSLCYLTLPVLGGNLDFRLKQSTEN